MGDRRDREGGLEGRGTGNSRKQRVRKKGQTITRIKDVTFERVEHSNKGIARKKIREYM